MTPERHDHQIVLRHFINCENTFKKHFPFGVFPAYLSGCLPVSKNILEIGVQVMAKAQSVATKTPENTALVTAGDTDFGQFAGAGMENVGSADILVPRLTILQALSPQVNKKKPEFIEGAATGMICDVGTGEIFPQGILFVPVYYTKQYLEWAPRESGKGLVEIHSDPSIMDETERNDKNQPVLANGNYVAETAQFFGLNLTADGRRCFIAMASSQLKKARRWLTLATGEKLRREDGSSFVPPLFYRSYNLTTAEESNAKGDWSVWKIERAAALPELGDAGFDWRDIKEQAVAFHASLVKGEVKADTSTLDETEHAAPSSSNEAPF